MHTRRPRPQVKVQSAKLGTCSIGNAIEAELLCPLEVPDRPVIQFQIQKVETVGKVHELDVEQSRVTSIGSLSSAILLLLNVFNLGLGLLQWLPSPASESRLSSSSLLRVLSTIDAC